MTAIRHRKRGKKPTKRLPLAELAALLRQLDRRAWTKLGVVIDPNETGDHFEKIYEGGVLVDILLEVETVPDRIYLTGCRLGTTFGIWVIPGVGEEVLVAVPDGQIDFSPVVVAFLSSGNISDPAGEGPAPNRTIIVNGEVLVHDGSGGAVPLAKASHKHELPNLVGASYAASGSGTDTWTGSDENTTILKAK